MGTAMAGKGKERDHAMLAAARAYTRRGWRVVPVRPREKGVTLSGWQQLRWRRLICGVGLAGRTRATSAS